MTAAASTLRDSYCSLAWGRRLAKETGPEVAGAVIGVPTKNLNPTERALARWARAVAPTRTPSTTGDVQRLRDAGFDEAQIFAITTFVALRLAFSTTNGAVGAASRLSTWAHGRLPRFVRRHVRPATGA